MNIFQTFKGQNEIDFIKTFSEKDKCFGYLSEYKWKDGFHCIHCGSKEEHNCNIAHHPDTSGVQTMFADCFSYGKYLVS